MTAEIICVGTELLLGDILNTNAQFLSRELAELGISVILIFRRRRFSRLLIIVSVAAFVFLPEPAAIVISYVHTVLIRIISEVNAYSVTVAYSCICII